MQPDIAFIILNDNNCFGLELTYKSILNQNNYYRFECCVIDNDSADSSVQFIKSHSDKLVYWVSRSYINISAAIDEVLPKLSAKYVYILTSGSTLYTNNVITEFLTGLNDEPDLIFGNIARAFLGKGEDLVIMPNPLTVEDIIYSSLDVLPSMIIKRSILNRYGFYDSDLEFTHAILFLLRATVLNASNCFYLNSTLCKINVYRNGSIHKISNAPLIEKEKIWLLDNYLPAPLKAFVKETQALKEIMARSVELASVDIFHFLKFKFITVLRPIYKICKYGLFSFNSVIELNWYKKKMAKQCFDIPIIINNRNHVSYLKRLIHSLEMKGYKNIFIIDNNSNYSALSEYYASLQYKVFLLKDNVGFCALWDTEIFDLFRDQYYVYTDSDIELIDECPSDFMVVMRYLLEKYKLGKIGLSLLTKDLPEHYENAEEVRDWESQFQQERVEKLAFVAKVDTTFALYSPNKFGHSYMIPAFRTSYPYSARHLPWYENTKKLTQEQSHYYENAKTSSHWSSKVKPS